jgi:hypothetical protein
MQKQKQVQEKIPPTCPLKLDQCFFYKGIRGIPKKMNENEIEICSFANNRNQLNLHT